MHFFLGIGISDLNMACRRALRKSLRGGGDTVDAVFADSPAAHNHQLARSGPLLLGRFAIDQGRHNSNSSNKYQTFAQVSRIKYDLAESRRYTAFIAAVTHPFDHPVQEPPWMQVRF